jgi:uncharacterized lipoprotein NlpE involved in copper resistance
MALAETEKKKMNVKGYLDALVDKQGLRTEVTITLTNETLIKTSLCLIGTAFVIIMMAYGAKLIWKSTQQTNS